MKKPNNILYGVDERPGHLVTLGLGVQHCVAMAGQIVLAVILVDLIGGTQTEAHTLVRMSMIAGGIGTILLSINRGPIGSGYLVPNLVGPAFMPAAVLAAKTGGLSLLFGMTCVAALFQVVLSRFVHKLRALLPAEVTGVIVAMVGVSLVPIGVGNLVGLGGGDTVSEVAEVGLGLFTLGMMFGVAVWARGRLQLMSVLIGVAAGYIVEAIFDLVPDKAYYEASSLALFGVPVPHLPTNLAFDTALLIPFLIAAVASSVKAVGDISTAQKINDEDWITPDMTSVRGGVLANALAVLAAGLLGAMPQSTSSANVGISLATGVTSRVVGFVAGGLFILFAFSPAISVVFVEMADPLKGAVLIFSACFIIVSGLQLVMSRLLDARKIFVVGTALAAGLSVDMLPQVYADVPHALQAFTTSSFSFATVVAVVLTLIFRIGIRRHASLELAPGDDGPGAVIRFLHDQGAAWGARVDVIKRATGALTEFVDVALPVGGIGQDVKIEAKYDQLYLDIYLYYRGEPIELPTVKPSLDDVVDDEKVLRRLAGYVIRSTANAVKASRDGDTNILHLRFEH